MSQKPQNQFVNKRKRKRGKRDDVDGEKKIKSEVIGSSYLQQQHQQNDRRAKSLTSADRQTILLTQSSAEIFNYFHTRRQGRLEYQLTLDLVDTLYNKLSSIYPGCGLYLVGSSVNGFGEKSSDIDMCLMLSNNEVSWHDAVQVLKRIKKVLLNMTSIRGIFLIKATVPIINFLDIYSGKDCDMNINNRSGIRNSHLLHYYSQFDSRVAPLVLFIKHWAKRHDINSAKNMTLSSYVLTLMVINFLQTGLGEKPVLPCLQSAYPELFPDDITQLKLDVPLAPFPAEKQNNMCVAELLLLFLEHYAVKFRYKYDVVSVRTGSILNIKDVLANIPVTGAKDKNQKPRKNTWDAMLFVEDPFENSNAARCVHQNSAFIRAKHIITRSYETLKETCNVLSIIQYPL